jgi:hypothetical protein
MAQLEKLTSFAQKRFYHEVNSIQKDILAHSMYLNSNHIVHTVYQGHLTKSEFTDFCVLVVKYLQSKNYEVKRIDAKLANLIVLRIKFNKED